MPAITLVIVMKDKNDSMQNIDYAFDKATDNQTFRGKLRVSADELKILGEEGNRRMEELDAADIGNYSE